jgi:hypothetical protein
LAPSGGHHADRARGVRHDPAKAPSVTPPHRPAGRWFRRLVVASNHARPEDVSSPGWDRRVSRMARYRAPAPSIRGPAHVRLAALRGAYHRGWDCGVAPGCLLALLVAQGRRPLRVVSYRAALPQDERARRRTGRGAPRRQGALRCRHAPLRRVRAHIAIALAMYGVGRLAGVHPPDWVKPYVLPVLWVTLALIACVGLLRGKRQWRAARPRRTKSCGIPAPPQRQRPGSGRQLGYEDAEAPISSTKHAIGAGTRSPKRRSMHGPARDDSFRPPPLPLRRGERLLSGSRRLMRGCGRRTRIPSPNAMEFS